MPGKAPRAVLVACLLLAAGACRSVPPAVPLPPGDPRPGALVSAWAESESQRRSLRGLARLAVDGGAGRVQIRSRQVLVVERPARLRVEILGFLSQTAAVLTTDGDSFQLWNLQDGSFAQGRVTPTLLWDVAYLALTPREAADVLLGAVLGASELSPLRGLAEGDGGIRVLLADARGAVRRSALFDREGLLRSVERREAGGEVAWEARYERYDPVGGIPFAHAITLDVAEGDAHARIELSQVELNPTLPPDMFRLSAPIAAGAGEAEGG